MKSRWNNELEKHFDRKRLRHIQQMFSTRGKDYVEIYDLKEAVTATWGNESGHVANKQQASKAQWIHVITKKEVQHANNLKKKCKRR